jgi:PAS domain S-box-containing protein
LSGRTAANLAGAPLTELFVHRDRRAIERLFLSIAEGSALRFDRQAQLALENGEGQWVEVRAAPLYDGEGKPMGVCGHIRDASELKRLAAQAEADGVRLLLLVDQIDTGVMLEDRDGNIQQVNPALCSVLALDAAPYSLEGMPVTEFFDSVSSNMLNSDVFRQHIAGMRTAGLDVNSDNLMMADGRVVLLDYLAITSGDDTVGRLWLARAAARSGI